jgi:ribosome-associated protein
VHDCSRIPLRSAPLRSEADTGTELWLAAVRAAESKKAADIRVLDLREVTSFADFFVISSGSNARQIQAISDEIGSRLKEQDVLPRSVEGYDHAEWILADYGDFIVHIFSERARAYYDLERLWRQAKPVEIPPV